MDRPRVPEESSGPDDHLTYAHSNEMDIEMDRGLRPILINVAPVQPFLPG